MEESTTTPTTRRTLRQKKPSLKAMESMYISKLKNSGLVAKLSSSSDEEFNFSEEEMNVEKPKLLHEQMEVCGKEIFTFQKRQQYARIDLQTKLTKTKLKNDVCFEDSGSEYDVSSESESSENENLSEGSNLSSGSSPSDKVVAKLNINKQNLKINNSKNILSSRGKKVNTNYTIDTEEYFQSCSSKKNKTSNNTLDKLQTPRLPQYELQKLLTAMTLPKEHHKAVQNLTETIQNEFKKWLYILNENFNILLYGLGSKKNLVNSFQKEYLQDMPVIVVNGFFPTLSIKSILDSIIEDLLELKENPVNPNEACNLIVREFENFPENHLYLIIHNIDGDCLRNIKTQNILARLVATENIHLIATIDHINAPLIWDHNKLSKFNYIWWDVTSFSPYSEETSFEKSMMVQQSGTLALSSLRNIFLSLTQNSKAIFLKIVNHQIQNSGQYYQGMAFKDLYMSCREAFVVSSDLALRAQLSEFIDHKMVKTKRSLDDGTEYLVIPLTNGLLQKFLEENS